MKTISDARTNRRLSPTRCDLDSPVPTILDAIILGAIILGAIIRLRFVLAVNSPQSTTRNYAKGGLRIEL
jgi:hypothetical protein